MNIALLSAALLLAAVPAFAQVPVLRCHEDVCDTVTQHVPVTPAILEGLKARQYVYVSPAGDGLTVTLVPDASTPPAAMPSTYPLTNSSYPNTPFYPAFAPAQWYPYPGFSEGFGSITPTVVVREIIREHDAPRSQPVAPTPATAPAKDVPRGSLELRRLNSVR